MIKPQYFVLTGAMGAGKSAVLARLRARQRPCIDDPARQILKEQRSIEGTGVPGIDDGLFSHLMLSRAIQLYQDNARAPEAVVFDRAIPDLIAYADLFGLDSAVFERAARIYRYNETVLYFAGWRDIYTTDDERKMDFDSANRFGQNAASVNSRLGYRTVEVPRVPADERASFILDVIDRSETR